MSDTPPATAHPAQRGALPRSDLPAWRRTIRYYVSRLFVATVVRLLLDVRVEGGERFARRPAIYCFSHLGWTDPFILMTVLPLRPKLFFFGPKEEDMSTGGRNRLMSWTGSSVPFKPGKNDLIDTVRRVEAVFAAGGVLAIAGEGRIHVRESEVSPLQEGTAYFALRSGLPIIPVAINGNSWLKFRRRIRVRIGEPIVPEGRPNREAVEVLTVRTWTALKGLVADAPDLPATGGFFGWLTELFNDWTEDPEAARFRAEQREAVRRRA